MNPNYVHTITVYRKQGDVFERTVLTGCFWKAQTVVSQSGTQATQSNVYTVRIPADKVPEGFRLAVNDIIVHGEVADEISNEKGSRAAEILLKYKPEAFRVTVFSDNTGHRADKHYRAGG